jgi:hypothetical protein
VQVIHNMANGSAGAISLGGFAIGTLSNGVYLQGNSAGWGGGGIATSDNSTLEMGSEVHIFNNTAKRYGGGVFSDGGSRVTFSQLSATGTVVVMGNVAAIAGGGFCFFSTACPEQDVKAVASLNTAPLGTDVYIEPRRLQVANGATQLDVVSRLDGSRIELIMLATGCRGFPTSTKIDGALPGVPIDSLTTSDTTGLASFRFPVRKPPGQYPLTFTTKHLDDSPERFTETNVTIQINVLGCPVGDVMASTGDACFTCDAGSYSRDARNTTCDKCPENAVCPGAWAVMPLPAYWSSSASSIQIHR